MAGPQINTDATKSLDFIVKFVNFILLLVTMSLVVSNSVLWYYHIGHTSHIVHLGALASTGYFFIYLIQILTILLGEKVPFTMGVLTAILGAIFNFCIAVTELNYTSGYSGGYWSKTQAYGSFCLFVTIGLVADALLTLKNKSSWKESWQEIHSHYTLFSLDYEHKQCDENLLMEIWSLWRTLQSGFYFVHISRHLFFTVKKYSQIGILGSSLLLPCSFLLKQRGDFWADSEPFIDMGHLVVIRGNYREPGKKILVRWKRQIFT